MTGPLPPSPSLPSLKIIFQGHPEFYDRAPELVELLGDEIRPEDRARLPRGWSILGGVVIVKIDPEIEDLKEKIGEALLDIYPRCSTVLLDRGIEGKFREPDRKVIEQLRGKRVARKKALFEEIGADGLGIAKVVARCIGCHGCSQACPVCYCHLCYFDSGAEEHGQSFYEDEAAARGYAKVLPDEVLYHLVRLYHIGISCVGCGLCSDVCPVDIPLWQLSAKAGEEIQRSFSYLPGRDVAEPVPLNTFKPEEPAGLA